MLVRMLRRCCVMSVNSENKSGFNAEVVGVLVHVNEKTLIGERGFSSLSCLVRGFSLYSLREPPVHDTRQGCSE